MAIGLLTLVLTWLAPAPPRTALMADLDGDGDAESLSFIASADATRGFLQLDGAGSDLPATSPLYPAWKAAAGRLAGESHDLIVLGAWTTKRTRPGEPARRTIWVVGLEHGRWLERWRGSALARPFDDYALRDVDGDQRDELVVRECPTDGVAPQGYTAYRWQGFGFIGVGRLARRCDEHPIPWHELRLAGGRLWLAQ